jgi:hypothetical protein
VKQDFITDFTPGQDTIFIQNDNGDNTYAIAYYNSVTADATFLNAGAGDVQVVIRRGDYNLTTGTFTQFGVGSGAGADYQVLFMTDGDDFAGSTILPPRGTGCVRWRWFRLRGRLARDRGAGSGRRGRQPVHLGHRVLRLIPAHWQGKPGVPVSLHHFPKGRLVRPFLFTTEWV